MKIFALLAFFLFSFGVRITPDPVKKIKLELTVEETDLIYYSLGKLPAETSEPLRAKIRMEFQRQAADTLNK